MALLAECGGGVMDGKGVQAKSPRRHFRLAFILGFLALFMTGYGLWVGIERAALFVAGAQAEGIVLRFEARRSSNGRLHHHPIIRFTDGAGRTIEFRGDWPVDIKEYQPGASVTVFFAPSRPERAMLGRFRRVVGRHHRNRWWRDMAWFFLACPAAGTPRDHGAGGAVARAVRRRLLLQRQQLHQEPDRQWRRKVGHLLFHFLRRQQIHALQHSGPQRERTGISIRISVRRGAQPNS